MHCILALTYSCSLYATQSNLYYMWQLHFTHFPITSAAFLTDRSPLSQCFCGRSSIHDCKVLSYLLSFLMRQAKCDQTQSAHAGNSRTSQMKRRVVRRCSGIDEIMKIPPYRVTSICALHDAWSVPEHVILHRHAIPIITIAPVAWPHMHMRSSHLLFGLVHLAAYVHVCYKL